MARCSFDLGEAVALVTGAGRGIGAATAAALAARGAHVICADLDGEAAAKTAADVGGRGVDLDVSDAAAWEALAADVQGEHGPLHLLVNNAGVGHSGRFADSPLEDWDWVLGANLMGVVHGCRAFGSAMVEAGRGHVVNVSSGLGYTPRATEPLYCTSKSAVLMLSRCLRADWRRHGVGVTAVCPGVIDTPIIRHTRFRGGEADPERVARVQRRFRRMGHSPEKVAAAIVAAVERDRPVAPVGIEAWVGWYLARVVPARLGDRMASSTLFDR